MKKSTMLYAALLLVEAHAVAQSKKVTYYANGNKEFEGEYRLVYTTADMRDLFTFDTAADKRKTMTLKMQQQRGGEREAAPQRIYNGKCVFYYDNGKTSYAGTYADGVKNGPFSYWYYGGAKEAEYGYKNGMADGKWKSWYVNGKTRTEQSYVALTAVELDSVYKSKTNSAMPFMGNPLFRDRGRLRVFTNDSLKKTPENAFAKFTEVENSLSKNAHWDGDFLSYWENGRKCTEMHYRNDVRMGTWYFWNDSGKVNVELSFEDGKIAAVKNNMPAEQRATVPGMPDPAAMMRPGYRDSMRAKMMHRADSLNKARRPMEKK